MNIRFFALTVPVLSLAACAVPEVYDDGGRGHMSSVQNQARPADFRAFSCENGLSVRVRHLDSGKVALRLDGRRAVLSSDVAASGERYTAEHGLFGNATEWHQKGGEAFFGFTDAYGNSVETSCRAR
ncbi:TPA: MliC family protein [Neisseria meningitidis]